MKEEKYNELTIKKIIERPIEETKYQYWGNAWVECECSCGKKIKAPLYGVVNNLIKSCGHLRKDKAREIINKIHEQNPTPTAKYITYNGETLNISEWSKKTGIPRTTIMNRLEKKWPIEKVLQKGGEQNDTRY